MSQVFLFQVSPSFQNQIRAFNGMEKKARPKISPIRRQLHRSNRILSPQMDDCIGGHWANRHAWKKNANSPAQVDWQQIWTRVKSLARSIPKLTPSGRNPYAGKGKKYPYQRTDNKQGKSIKKGSQKTTASGRPRRVAASRAMARIKFSALQQAKDRHIHEDYADDDGFTVGNTNDMHELQGSSVSSGDPESDSGNVSKTGEENPTIQIQKVNFQRRRRCQRRLSDSSISSLELTTVAPKQNHQEEQTP
ncbi:hypothetical protein VTN77DRAFT_8088 [Rasamsonia byssochlamydoides]|uniref:uncharacterized protein n=1 Tax=Rasamsonia byssochlamydoides TaxID=89139 RepID=UPI0037427B13